MGIFGPEVTLQLALGQRLSAAQSVKDFGEVGNQKWSLRHAFFADMGGFVLNTPDEVDFPVNAKQVHYLVTKGYIAMPTVTAEEIKDKDKVDPLLRAISVFQILWFVLNSIARAAQHLAITAFELTTLGFIYCTLGTHICWIHKPADVNVPVVLRCSQTIGRIRAEAGLPPASPAKTLTPLDFVGRKDWVWGAWWTWALESTPFFLGLRFRPKRRPITRMLNDEWPELPLVATAGLTLYDMTYAAIYVAGWNMWFVTDLERLLWRLSSLMMLIAFPVFFAIYALFLAQPTLQRWYRQLQRPTKRTQQPHSDLIAANAAKRDATAIVSPPLAQQPFHLPVRFAILLTATAAVYILARSYVLVDCIIALRQLPASAYVTVAWPGFLAHV